jgi:hypothetical protein
MLTVAAVKPANSAVVGGMQTVTEEAVITLHPNVRGLHPLTVEPTTWSSIACAGAVRGEVPWRTRY